MYCRLGRRCVKTPDARDAKKNATAAESKTLKLVQNFQRESLGGVVGLTISPDGQYLYASAYAKATLHVFSIDQQNGQLTLVEDIADRGKLQGVTDFCLSPDGKLGIASAFSSKAVTLFQRDPGSGKLTMLDSLDARSSGVRGFDWPIRADFSLDGKFVYVANSGRVASRGIITSIFSVVTPSVIVLKVVDKQLEFVESFTTDQRELADARGIAIHPNGINLFVTSSDGKSLVCLRRDPETGKLNLVKAIRSNPDAVDVLEGAMSVVTDQSGRFIYTLAGRFRGGWRNRCFLIRPRQQRHHFP